VLMCVTLISHMHLTVYLYACKLIQKVVAYGISRDCINWLISFLLERSLCVKINYVLSDSACQINEISQGSMSGPICFVL
jgi:hypothetical protein